MAIFQKAEIANIVATAKRRSSATKVSRPGYQAFPAAVKCLPLTVVAMEMGRKRPPESAHPEVKAGRDPRKVDRGGIGLQIEVPGSRRYVPDTRKREMPFFFQRKVFREEENGLGLKVGRKRIMRLEIQLMVNPRVL